MTTAAVRTLFVETTIRFETVVARSGAAVRVSVGGPEVPPQAGRRPEGRTRPEVPPQAGRRPEGRTGTESAAEIAASCLVRPEVGDRVLVARSGDEAYVLAVLARAGESETTLAFDRDVALHVSEGRLRVVAQGGVEVASPGALEVRVDAITTKAKRVRLVAEAVDTIAGRIFERAVNFFRRTDELDRVEAKNIERRAEHLLHTHAENAVTTAEQLVKVDACQVHVG